MADEMSTDFPGTKRGRGDTITVVNEPATTKRKDDGTDDETQVSGIKQHAPDTALAVSMADLQALVDHARKTGAEALAAKFPNL